MAEFKVATKNQTGIDKKPRVYFTCHPDDFEKYFDKICEDIFKTHDCAIYYTGDMAETIAQDEKEVDLGRSNMLVVPVTFKLLSTPNRAMDEDIPYALQKHIPVLPIMMETGIDQYYSKPDKFGKLQYLNPYSTDLTEISYEEKLKKYLESVLISDEMAKRVRAAFDAYIFLSYRKKDRKYANELMQLIHSNPECRDIAIWFDEFLAPGENFKEAIEKILDDCKLFTLLVTPRLLEKIIDENGEERDNYIISTELPLARKKKEEKGTDIFAVEMEATDKEKLSSISIEEYINSEDEAFRARLLDAISKIVVTENNTPEHNFLIGLAYLDGIDVEVNRERGIELISSAAEEGISEAILKLYNMYSRGVGANVDYRKAVYWAEKAVDYYTSEYGENNTNTIAAIGNLAEAYGDLGNLPKALELNEKAYKLSCRISGEEHPDTLIYLNNLAVSYRQNGNLQKALELIEKACSLKCNILGEEHHSTLTSLNELATLHGYLGNVQKALKLSEKVYSLSQRILGEEHYDTLVSLRNLAGAYGALGNLQKELELNEKAYSLSRTILGEEHPCTLILLNCLAGAYGDAGNLQKILELSEKAYNTSCRILGEEHPDTLSAVNTLTMAYCGLSDFQQAFELSEKAYNTSCRILGEEHPHTMTFLNNLAYTCGKLGNLPKTLELNEKLFKLRCRIYGKEHPDTLTSMNNLALNYSYIGDFQKALKLADEACFLSCNILGEEHPDTLMYLSNLTYICGELGDMQNAFELKEKVYRLSCTVLGEEHPSTMIYQNNLAEAYAKLGDASKAFGLLENLYEKQCRIFGEKGSETVETLENLIIVSKLARDRKTEKFYKNKLKSLKKN